jgi:hypothetical protein
MTFTTRRQRLTFEEGRLSTIDQGAHRISALPFVGATKPSPFGRQTWGGNGLGCGAIGPTTD